MCDPVSAAIAMSALQAFGSLSAAQAQLDAGKANAKGITQQAEYDEDRRREELARVQGAARAAAGASNLQLAGSPLDVIAENAAQGEMDALAIRWSGRQAAAAARVEASSAAAASTIDAFGAVLSGASAWDRLAGKPTAPTITRTRSTTIYG